MDLNAPLGMSSPPPLRRRWLGVFIGGFGLAGLAGLGLALAWGDPHGGRPFATVDVPPMLPPPTAVVPEVPPGATTTASGGAPLDALPTGTTVSPGLPPARRSDAGRTANLESGVLVHRGPLDDTPAARAAAPGPLVIDVSRALDAPFGKTKPTGSAKAAEPAKPRAPRIAIFVSGMGLDVAATKTAIDTMPPAVTLAFVPYGANVSATVASAKSKGHEVLLQLPMRDGGHNTPGPHALRPDAPVETLKSDLAWLMTRFDGYDGVSNLLGADMTADAAAMTTVMKAVRARHVFYLDDGTSRRSVVADLAPELGLDAIKTDLVLDATADPAVVRANLDQLSTIARRKGQAIGMASGLPEHLGAIARFAAGLGAKGIELVPVNALSRGDPASTPSGAAASR